MRWMLLWTGLTLVGSGWLCSVPSAEADEATPVECIRVWWSCGPASLAFVADGSVVVANAMCGQVTHYDSMGAELNHWTSPTGDSGLPYFPSGIDLDGAGNVFVANLYEKRVERFTLDGTLVAAYGVGTLIHPTGIAVDRGTGHLFVCDGGEGVIREYDATGTLLRNVVAGYEVTDVALAPGGNLYVCFYNGVVWALDAGGSLLASWTVPDQGPETRFRGIAVSPDGNVHVAYRSSGRVLTLSSSLQYLGDWPITCFEPSPAFSGLDFDGRGQAVLSQDYGLGQIGLFSLETSVPVASTTWGKLKSLYR